jgi:hypothetical protein
MLDLGGRIREQLDLAAPPIDLADVQARMHPVRVDRAGQEEPFMIRRSMSVFAAAFAVVLVVGVAFAQVGAFAPDSDERESDERALTERETDVRDTDRRETDARETDARETDARETDERDTDRARDEEPVRDEPVETDRERDEETDRPDTTPPRFEILHPEDGQRFDVREVVFEGHVEPGSRVFAGDYEADVREDGTWRIVLLLSPGRNVATLKAIDRAGNVSDDTVTVYLDAETDKPKDEEPRDEPKDGKPPKEEPPKEESPKEEPPKEEPPAEEPAAVEFSAIQQYGSCAEPVPFDVFYGTATPGTEVHIISPYGSGVAVANGDGHWEKRVEFPNAPFDGTFEVVVEGDGGRSVFSFVRTGEGEHEG